LGRIIIETRLRSVLKTIGWRIIAILNSFVILTSGLSEDALLNALYMNLTGLFLYYFYERAYNQLPHGITEIKK
tara:strand:- start:36 stop:257 length:222 start_codon:yes stop_codon:yes gene_type:complete